MKRSVILVASLLIGLQASASAADPAWWATRGVKNSESSSNLSAATVGQAKHVVAMALKELETRLPPAAYDALETDVEAIVDLAVPTTQAGFDAQKAVLAVGQLKAISAPFYQRLDAENHLWLEFQLNKNRTKDPANAANMFPWTSATGDDQNKAIATIGQLKAVFALRFESLNLDPEGDEDGDGLTNGDEVIFGTDPLDASDGPQVDSDGDGVPNTTETANGTDPDNAGDFPVQWLTARNQVIGATHKDTNRNVHSGDMRYNRWDDVSVDDTDIASELTPEMMIAARDNLDKVPLPDLQELVGSGKADAFNLPDAHPVAGASFDMDPASVPHAPRGGNYTVRRCWLHAPAKPDAQEFHFLKTTQHYYTNSAGTFYDDSVIELLTVVIPADQSYSDHIDLKTTTSAQVGTGHKTFVSLVPVEIEQQDYSAAQGIRFCRWLDGFFSGGTFDPDCANKDRDRFRIRIPMVLPNLTKIHIKTTGLEGAIINGEWQMKGTDGNYDVSLTQENGAMVSTWMLLVSDGDDDRNYNGKGAADDSLDDQTLHADFNSPIVVTLPELGNAEAVFHAQKPLGHVTVDAFYLSPVADPTGDPTVSVPEDMQRFISNQIGKMKEIYRQIGVEVHFNSLKGIGVPQAWFDPVAVPNEAAKHLKPYECSAAYNTLKRQSVPEHHMRIGYVDATLKVDALDTAFSRGFTKSWNNGGVYSGIEGSIVSLAPDSRVKLGVTAHETGHVLDLDHTPETARRWLMKDHDLIWNNDQLDSKRFQEGDFEIIRKKNSYYVPN